nr:MAG TPA: hypothetical protein [Caudoviricetes sp.]
MTPQRYKIVNSRSGVGAPEREKRADRFTGFLPFHSI